MAGEFAEWLREDTDEVLVSGTGGPAPAAVRRMGWSWGAFFGGWIWAVSNRVWVGLLDVPLSGNLLFMVIFRLVLGSKGNEWAWQHRRFRDIEHFRRVQRRWAWLGPLALLAHLVLLLWLLPMLVSPLAPGLVGGLGSGGG